MDYSAWKTILQKTKSLRLEKGLTSFINPFSMLLLRDYPDIATHIDYWYVDGISLVKQINQYRQAKIERHSFDDTSLAPVVFDFVKQNGYTLAIIGTKEEFIHDAVSTIENKFGIKVQYFRNGYFLDKADRANCIEFVKNQHFDVVVCGMGTPYQELFLIDLKKAGWEGFGFTCGGYLHQISKKENYYPAFFDKLDIRWIYRILDEPKLLRRYIVEYPKFFFYFNLNRSVLFSKKD